VCFDDGRLSALLQGKPPLDDFGWAASEYPIVDLIPEARDGRHMTVADLRQCREIAGWEIGLHSQTLRDHDAGFDRLSPDEIKRNLRADRAWVRQNNLGDGDGFAWPLGAFSSASQDAVSSMCAYARLNTTTSLETWPPENVMKIRSAANTDSVAKMKSMVDETSASASWLCLTFHDITPDGAGAEACSTAAYKAVLNYIARRKLSVLPVIDVLRKGGSR
jgi:peptidoglycan/xylan/chitin deacetylase (PgdA/CDA1 family)